jgi:hypothetical protein
MDGLRDTMRRKREIVNLKYGSNPTLYSSGEKFDYRKIIGKMRINLDPKILNK